MFSLLLSPSSPFRLFIQSACSKEEHQETGNLHLSVVRQIHAIRILSVNGIHIYVKPNKKNKRKNKRQELVPHPPLHPSFSPRTHKKKTNRERTQAAAHSFLFPPPVHSGCTAVITKIYFQATWPISLQVGSSALFVQRLQDEQMAVQLDSARRYAVGNDSKILVTLDIYLYNKLSMQLLKITLSP